MNFNWFFVHYDWVFWAALPALMLHQFEEYIYPGGFRSWMNRTVNHSESADIPLTKKRALVINVPVLWTLFGLVALIGSDRLWFSLGMISILFVNSWFHLVMSLVTDEYVPGTYTSLIVFLPLTIYTYSYFLTTWQAGFQLVFYSIIFGILVHMLIVTVGRGWTQKVMNDKST